MTGTDVNSVRCFIPIPYSQGMSIPYAFTIELPSAHLQINRAIFSSLVGED